MSSKSLPGGSQCRQLAKFCTGTTGHMFIAPPVNNLGKFDDILDEIGDFVFGWKKNDIFDKIFLVSLNMLAAQNKISAAIKRITYH